MIVEAIALGSINLTYKPPEPPPLEVGRPVIKIELVEALEKPELVELAPLPEKPLEPPIRPSDGTNTYEPLSCTWWVKQWKPSVPNSWGNANTWDDRAATDGWTVSDTPVPGAVAQSDRGGWGHVALVLEVYGNTILIQEGNYDYAGSTRTKTVPTSSYTYIY